METRNQADQLVHQTDKLLEEQGEQMTEDEKSSVESALAELKETLSDEDTETEALRAKMEELIQTSQEMATRLYQQAAAEQAGEPEAGDDASDEDIVEAEIVDEDE